MCVYAGLFNGNNPFLYTGKFYLCYHQDKTVKTDMLRSCTHLKSQKDDVLPKGNTYIQNRHPLQNVRELHMGSWEKSGCILKALHVEMALMMAVEWDKGKAPMLLTR